MASVLLADDNDSFCKSTQRYLGTSGIDVDITRSGSEAIERATTQRLRLLLIDFRLPDMTGLEVVRALRVRGLRPPFVLISGYGSIPIAVEAMKLGALDVLEKPVSPARLLSTVRSGIARRGGSSSVLLVGHSPTQRWANWAVRGTQSPDDLKSLARWARFVGVGYSTLREGCYLVHIQPQAARDFVRALRAIVRASVGLDGFDNLLDVSDRRSLRAFHRRAGVMLDSQLSLESFWHHQRLIPADNRALIATRELLEQDRLFAVIEMPKRE